jgi:hypothetical protein
VKVLFSVLLAVALQFGDLWAQPPGDELVAPPRAVLSFETLRDFGSATAKIGDRIPLRMEQSLSVDGKRLLRAGTIIEARVAHVRRAGKRCHYGRVDLELNELRLPTGQAVKVRIFGMAYPLRNTASVAAAVPVPAPSSSPPPLPTPKRGLAGKVLNEVGNVILAPAVPLLWMVIAHAETRCQSPELQTEESNTLAGTRVFVTFLPSQPAPRRHEESFEAFSSRPPQPQHLR